MNILILSVGSRSKLVRYFREALRGAGRVVAADMSPLAPALWEADERRIVPRLDSPDYLEVIIEVCRECKIDGVLSLIDPELGVLARHSEDLLSVGAMLVGSGADQCDMALDKLEMHSWLTAHGYPCARSYESLDALDFAIQAGEESFPVFVKPARGSASLGIGLAEDRSAAAFLLAHGEGMMAQQALSGQEVGIDAYVDMLSGEVVSLFAKRKLRMRAGETDRSVSFRDSSLFELVSRLLQEAGFRGPVDVDVFDVDGTYFISEVNPRFGGGYPHAHECGCDFPGLILENLAGRENPPRIGNYEEGVYMMKYSEVLVSRMPSVQ